MEAEDGNVAVAAVADGPVAVGCSHRVRGILDDLEAIAAGHLRDRPHVSALTSQVHGHHHFRQPPIPRRRFQLLRQPLDGHVVRCWIDVDEIDPSAAIKRAIGARDEGDRTGPQQVARTKAERQAGDVQRRSSIANRDSVCRTAISRERLLEPRHRRTLGQEIGLQHFDDRVDIGRVDRLAAVGNHDAISSG